jgi:hypothetical protein
MHDELGLRLWHYWIEPGFETLEGSRRTRRAAGRFQGAPLMPVKKRFAKDRNFQITGAAIQASI